MWVYGDRTRRTTPRAALRELTASLRDVESAGPGAARHDRLTRAFIQAGALAQGVADAEFAARGFDDASPAQDAAMSLLTALARKLAASAWSGFATAGPPTSAELMALALSPLPEEIELKTPEGYAFYGLYPEAYLKAAAERDWDAPPFVIGIRSIGTGLAALVAAVTGAVDVATLRPTGHPFHREVRVSNTMRERLSAHAGPFAVVDEGPGLSGSSFGAAADLLTSLGISLERIVFMPSHAGGPGPEAAAAHRQTWDSVGMRPATFDALIAEEPLAGWFAEVVEGIEAVEDISGGAWAERRSDAAVHPALERRKFWLLAEGRTYLAKFAGLGEPGEAKYARARTLARAGAGPEPVALTRGFLVERWIDGVPGLHADPLTVAEHVGRYLGLRALAFPAEADQGASLEDLAVMARTNAQELGLEPSLVPPPPADAGRPIHVDGRLHRWEWITTAGGRLIKTDAVDHSCGHDLVGCQDVAWDVAGAKVELDLDDGAAEALIAALERVSERRVDRALLAFFDVAYPAFQAGLWRLAGDEAQVQRYAARLA
ncbi:hypothetical protein [Phenylobacterium soli]|uniref:Uncharacterized protein n=1 Tax=Phenylobacterium soli TaxID=2170551 RepID=A0A328AQ29_9CAUL|nr:hypothetical protein [Phenylobacterium soli]RAK54988.1 hypothetical protein DJ017_10845 [Phenylobacterium soli]